MPDTVISTNLSGVITTNLIYIPVDEVLYGTGGRWGNWSDGGGSSLELIDPRSDNRLPSNSADSDDATKSTWTPLSISGATLDHAQGSLSDWNGVSNYTCWMPGSAWWILSSFLLLLHLRRGTL